MPRESGHLRCDGCGSVTTDRPEADWLVLSGGHRTFCLDCVARLESGEIDRRFETLLSTCDRCGTSESTEWFTTLGDDGRVVQVCAACLRPDDPRSAAGRRS